MDQATWLSCGDPRALFDVVAPTATERKMRLLACACCRRIWRLLTERSRRAVEAAERFADGELSAGELEKYHADAFAVFAQVRGAVQDRRAADPALAATYAARTTTDSIHGFLLGAEAARSAAEGDDVPAPWQCALLRDIINPFWQGAIEPSWLAWEGGTVTRLARSIHAEQDFGRLPVLGDALEEAGCSDQVLLDHCRSGHEHVRGCWLVDLLLGLA
jgi:hypothetical protein